MVHAIDMSLGKLQEMVKDRGAWRAAVRRSQRVRLDLATECPLRRKGTLTWLPAKLRKEEVRSDRDTEDRRRDFTETF